VDYWGVVPEAFGGGQWVHIDVFYDVVVALCEEHVRLFVAFVLVIVSTEYDDFVRSHLGGCGC
jgi:hypothetical protein